MLLERGVLDPGLEIVRIELKRLLVIFNGLSPFAILQIKVPQDLS